MNRSTDVTFVKLGEQLLIHLDLPLTTTAHHLKGNRVNVVYQILAESGGSSDQESTLGKKITPDWMYNLGETAVDIAAVAWSVANCDVVILGQRNLFCLKDNGNLRFMKRLEYKPLCIHPYFVGPPSVVGRSHNRLGCRRWRDWDLNPALL
uniref:PTHB1 N-terminal domain-containing protein n=1 Tax=Timema tahoe TaxID=61484 RepID=A0A7R9IPY6_9NEOP|nr:unnamed protein product [Timema tahoe]